MRKALPFILLSAFVLLPTGCDFLRKAAGRPTSDEIELKRELIREHEAQLKAMEEAAQKAAEYTRDSTDAWNAIEASGRKVRTASEFKRMDADILDYDYYLVVGSFSDERNALKVVSAVLESGFQASTIALRPGFTAVGACPSNDIVEFNKSVNEVVGKPFCPSDAWILAK